MMIGARQPRPRAARTSSRPPPSGSRIDQADVEAARPNSRQRTFELAHAIDREHEMRCCVQQALREAAVALVRLDQQDAHRHPPEQPSGVLDRPGRARQGRGADGLESVDRRRLVHVREIALGLVTTVDVPSKKSTALQNQCAKTPGPKTH
jgi:hypothetical protein